MKILQINCVYGRGSTGKIVKDIHEQLLVEGYESIVCYGRQRSVTDSIPNVYKFCTELEGDIWHVLNRYWGTLAYGGMWLSTRKLISIIRLENPDIVHLHCINGYSVNIYRLLKYLGIHNIKTVVTHHAEFFYTGNCGHAYDCLKWTKESGCGKCPILVEATGSRYFDNTTKAWEKMKEAFTFHKKDNLLFTAVSPWVKSRMKMSPIINGYECIVVENGLDVSIFHPYEKTNSITPFVFHATAYFTTNKNNIKGGYYIAELARKLPNVLFKVACGSLGEIENIPDNLKILGKVANQSELARLYSQADLTVISSKRETFSMITAESLCCGTPIVGFKAGGPESIAIPDYSNFVEYGDMNTLEQAVISALTKQYNKNDIASEAQKHYSASVMTHGYIDVYRRLVSI